ncbi:anillin isoform X2 [Polistes fuscatus]|uniref:anillin isoform X2 n=1 Tax=Polistes fuscatus TaxID=30207 RepID=UPI001CA85AE1|nr:anillin isoform X2 [Polistes fuscatus]
MDPWIQRMLERAKVRGEKLNMQLSNAGHDVRRRRSPLKDANAIIAQATVNKNKSPTKSPIKSMSEESPKKSARKCSPQKERVEEEEEAKQTDKENGELGISNVKFKLQRLGKLYSEDTCELSSPIHKTEEKFYAEEDNQTEFKSVKKGARLDRLAALASTINNWEDDLSHPVITKTSSNKAEQIQAKFNDKVKNTTEPQPSTSGCSKLNSGSNSEGSSTKQLKWDKSVLQSLEAQGFSRTKSNCRLVYDFKSCSQESGGGPSSSSPKKDKNTVQRQEEKNISSSKLNVVLEGKVTNDDNAHKSANRTTKENANSNTPEKTVRTTNANTNNSRITSRLGFNGSPKSPIPGSSPGSVLSKASMFESRNNDTKAKDPAQMSLSERKALFEKNKDEAPLIPKAPLTMSIPPSKLHEKETSNSPHGHGADPSANNRKAENSNRVVTQRAIFEHGHTQELENNILRSAQIERQRELDMLRSRFNTNKEIAQAAAGSCIRTSESSEGKSNSPKNSPICPVKPTPALPPPPPPPLPQSSNLNQKHHLEQEKSSPVKRQGNLPKVLKTVALPDVKRIRVSPPKPGKLYPSLSDIEISTETETEYTVNSTEPVTATLEENTTESESFTEAEYYVEDNETQLDTEDEIEDETQDVNTSLGKSILHEVDQKIIMNRKKRSIEPDPDSTTSDISVLDEMDEYLDECLAAQDRDAKNYGPTPPKVNRGEKSPEVASSSFTYKRGPLYRSPVVRPMTPEDRNQPYIVEGDRQTPLLRTVSCYRREQSELRTPKGTPLSISKIGESSSDSTEPSKDETILVKEKVKHLLDEVSKQQTIIGQASQALNLCSSTIEFNQSQEQVEVEKLLLVATHRRQAAINEIQRLKVQGTLRPSAPGSPEIDDTGSLTISAITLPLRREFLRSIAPTTRLHFVCLILHLDEVLATPVVVAESGDSCLRFPSTLKLQNLYSDFKVTVEIYSLRTQAEMLPHEVKYHIYNNGSGPSGNSSKDKKLLPKTPKKCSKSDNRLVMPNVQSPAGPSSIQFSAFQLHGYIVFSLKEVNRQQFTLNKVPQKSPLEGRLQMHMSCEPSITVEYRNFFTIFEYVSGFGSWQRRWMVLKGTTLSYYKYPHHEGKKTPLGSLDLRGVSTKIVDLAPFNICMRANTVLLESKRVAQPGDTDSLIMVTNGSETTIRHLYSADTKEDRLEWCSKLNKVLHILQVWGNSSDHI